MLIDCATSLYDAAVLSVSVVDGLVVQHQRRYDAGPMTNQRLLAALLLLTGLAVDAAAQSDRLVITERPDAYVLTVPVSRLVMTIPKEKFIAGSAPRADATASSRYFYFEDTSKHIAISGWFESQNGFRGMDEFWKKESASWSQQKMPAQTNVTFKRIGGWDTVFYRVTQPIGISSNIRAEWVSAGTWIDLHISTVSDSAAENQSNLESLLARIQVSEKAANEAAEVAVRSPSESMKLLEDGSRSYLKHDYRAAIGPYAKALELEKKQVTLDKTLWHVLIDNLGMAYGISGDLKRARETFEYGLSQDKTYPMFYYNLACTYAEMSDVDRAIANLRLAFQFKANVLPGEQVPDPRNDDSFQRFAESERFNHALREMGVGGK
jgi:tetratricopeptide (TPR) repeat protein